MNLLLPSLPHQHDALFFVFCLQAFCLGEFDFGMNSEKLLTTSEKNATD